MGYRKLKIFCRCSLLPSFLVGLRTYQHPCSACTTGWISEESWHVSQQGAADYSLRQSVQTGLRTHAGSYSKTLFPAVKQRGHKYNHSLSKLRLKWSVLHTSISCHGAMFKHRDLPKSTYEIFGQTRSLYCEVLLCDLCKVGIKESHFQ